MIDEKILNLTIKEYLTQLHSYITELKVNNKHKLFIEALTENGEFIIGKFDKNKIINVGIEIVGANGGDFELCLNFNYMNADCTIKQIIDLYEKQKELINKKQEMGD